MKHKLLLDSFCEFRQPKKGEQYISGAIPSKYYAPNDLSSNHWVIIGSNATALNLLNLEIQYKVVEAIQQAGQKWPGLTKDMTLLALDSVRERIKTL